jgi:hypothetical protein
LNAHSSQGSLFGPYTPLQQLDILADFGTKSYIVGSTNSLLLQQKDRYSDILINLDEGTINVTSPSLKAALQLSTPDRRWIDFITQNVNDTWDESNPSRPKTMGYVGSEEFIRVQFEEYLLSLISAVKYRAHLARHAQNPRIMLLPEIDGDPSLDFGAEFVEAWSRTENHRIWNANTDSHLFDIVEPKHPCAGGLTIDDIQRRITQQVQDLHWDERFAQGREVLGRNLAAGREKASTLFNKLYADMEALREAQRKRNEEARAQQQQQQLQSGSGGGSEKNGGTGVDLAKAQQTMQAVGSKAGAFVNSWAAWAGEKRRAAWGGKSSTASGGDSNSNSNGAGGSPTTSTGGGGWGSGWVKINKSRNSQIQPRSSASDDARSEKDGNTQYAAVRTSTSSASRGVDVAAEQQPLNRRDSVSGESMLDDIGPDSALSSPGKGRPGSAAGGGSVPVPVPDEKTNGSGNGVVDPALVPAARPPNGSGGQVDLGVKGQEQDDGPDAEPSPPLPNPATAEAVQAQEAWEKR